MKLTFKQIAEKAGVNPSTAAFQRDKFLSYFSYTGEGRRRKYGEDSIELLRTISTLYAEGKTYEDILDVLENRFGVQVTDVAVQEPKIDVVETIRGVMREELSRRDNAIERLEEKVDELINGSKERDLILMETLREIQKKNEKKGWRFWR